MIDHAQYQAAQAAIGTRLARIITRAMRKFGVPLAPQQRMQFARRVTPAVRNAREASYGLALEYMQYSADQAGEAMPEPAPIRRYEQAAVVSVLERFIEPIERAQVTIHDDNDQAGRDDPVVEIDLDVAEKIGANVADALVRHAHQAGRDVVQDTADAQSEQIGWARVLNGPGDCPFCAMLASRGPVYDSEHAALFQGMSQRAYHDRCDCTAELVFEGQDWDGREDFERLDKLWAESTRRLSGKAARKAFAAAYHVQQAAAQRPELSDDDLDHVLGGEPGTRLGGHRAGTGKLGKSEYPPSWSDQMIADAIDETLSEPDKIIRGGDRTDYLREVDGVIVRASTYRDGDRPIFRTAYPVNGDGVIENTPTGVKQLPLDRSILEP